MKRQKNYLLVAVVFINSTLLAQTGNVGINTTTPTKTLDVNGTARVRTLPVMGTGTNVVADAQGNLGISRSIDSDFILYHTSNDVRQNTPFDVPSSSILNVPQTNAQDGGDGNTIKAINCWTVPNSEVYLKFPSDGSNRRGTVSWNTWFEVSGIQGSMAFPLIPSVLDDPNSTKVRGPIWWHNRLYAVLSIKSGNVWNHVQTRSVNMTTTYIQPDFREAVRYDPSGNLHANPGQSNSNYRYFITAFFSVGEGTDINVLPNSEYKIELKFGIENLSTQHNTAFNPLTNWGIQSNALSFVKM
jgi:hypothetical protein